MNFPRANKSWLGSCPDDWQTDRLKDIIPVIVGGGTPSSSDPDCWENGDIVWVTPTDFSHSEGDSAIFDSERKITRIGLASCTATLLPKQSVIMASRATIGTVRIAGIDLATNQGFISFVCDERKLHHRFLYYVISGFLGEYFAQIAPGTTFFEISRGKAKIEPICFPTLPEQARIAAYLDASCAAIDAAVAAKRRQIETLDKLQQLFITKAITRGIEESVKLKYSGIEGLGLIPHHWRRTKLRYEVAISNGDFISDKLEDDGIYPVIGGNGQMGHTSGYNTDGEIVVVGRVGANCGNAHYIKGRAWISDNALIVHSNHDKRFLMHLFRALDFNSMARRTAQPLITSTQIKNTYVALPKIDEQVEIADFIQKQIVHFDELRNNLVKQIETLLAYRKSLIHECVTGQRRISEADLNQVKAYG